MFQNQNWNFSYIAVHYCFRLKNEVLYVWFSNQIVTDIKLSIKDKLEKCYFIQPDTTLSNLTSHDDSLHMIIK